jgi:F-type H+-transporting ATPase subunit b
MPQITQLPFIFASQFFWLAVFFGLIFFVIARGMVPKIKSTVAARDEKIAEDLQKAQAARVAADETEAAWRARMDAARVDAARIAHEAKQESARETEARVKAALGEIDARVDQARVRIWTSVQAARAEFEAVAADAAQQMVEQLIGMKISPEDAANAVAAELKALGKSDGSAQSPMQEHKPQQVASLAR